MTSKESRTGHRMMVVPSTNGRVIKGDRNSILVPNDWWMVCGRVMLMIPPDVSFRDRQSVETHQESVRLFGRRLDEVQRFVRSVGFGHIPARINIDCLATEFVWFSHLPFGVCVSSFTTGVPCETTRGNFNFLLPQQVHKCQPGQQIPIPEEVMPTVYRYGETDWINLVHLAKAIKLTPLETVNAFLRARAVSKGETAYVYVPSENELGSSNMEKSPKIQGEGAGIQSVIALIERQPQNRAAERDPKNVWVTLKAAEFVLRLHLLGLNGAKDALSL